MFDPMRWKKLNTAIGVGLTCCMGFCNPVRAQVYSQNVVGYINQELFPGNNLIANQLGTGDDTLTNLFNAPIPEGTTFTKWDASLAEFLPLSSYDTNSGWSINYGLTYGEGGELNAPSAFTNTFVGTVWPGFNLNGPYNPPLVTANGLMLLSCFIPIGNASFYDVVGRDPNDGESVTTLDALSQTSTTTTFDNGVWNNGDPALAVGQSAFFNLGNNLGPDLGTVPEPATWTLLGAGLLSLANLRRKRGLMKTIGK